MHGLVTHATSSGTDLPLAGVRVLDLTRLLPGNYCTWLLAALGADVIKVEDPGAGDYMRSFGLQVEGQGATHHVVNRAKRSVVVDLKRAQGREAFLRLARTADVVVESFRPGVMERLGVGPDVLRAEHRALVVASISGHGHDGPLRDTIAHDLNALAFSGLLELLVGSDGLPLVPPIPLADIVAGGLIPALGITALLHRVRQTGEGGWLDAALADGFALLPSVLVGDLLAGGPPRRAGTREFDGDPCYRVYALRDGLIAVAALEPEFWAVLCEALGEDDLVGAQWNPARREEGVARLTERFAAMTRAEVSALLAGRDTCASIVQSYEEMLRSEQARIRDLVRPAADVPMDVLAPPFRIDGHRPPERGGAPRQGEQTREVLIEAGFSGDEVDALLACGAVV